MRLKRYCVTFSDNWTPLKYFWTLEGAKKVYRQHRTYSNVFVWNEYEWKLGGWEWLCGARDLDGGEKSTWATSSPSAKFIEIWTV